MTEEETTKAPIKIVIQGVGGRMGQALIAAAGEDEAVELAGAVERTGHEIVGVSVQPQVVVTDDLGSALEGGEVLIDFTTPETTIDALEVAAARGTAAVVGTTGLTEAQHEQMARYAEACPVVYAPNMSVGVNVMLGLIDIAARALGEDYDIEITEAHHRRKVDAPSGTALKMADVLAEARGWDLDEVIRCGREGHTGPRKDRELGIQVMRGGDVTGEHTVFFLGTGERLEVTHRAGSRAIFARGALRAARWIAGREPGLYGMKDVLGL